MNFYARVRDQRLDNQAEMQNYTVGYIGLNPHPAGQQMVPRQDPLAKLETLEAKQLLQKDGHLEIYRRHCWAGILGVLSSYSGSHLAQRPKARPHPFAIIRLERDVRTVGQ
jgi:hypothetical protein